MSETVLHVLRIDPDDGQPEAELLTVERRGARVLLTLDDGATLNLHAGELAFAIVDLATPELRAA
jgi:hypothetical protein